MMQSMVDDNPQSFMDLVAGFACNSPTKFLTFPLDHPAPDVQQFLLDHILLDPHFVDYPASKQYQTLFWKWVIKHLEDALTQDTEDVEIDSRIYEHYTSLISSTSLSSTIHAQPPSPSYLAYFWKNRSLYERSTLMESRKMIEDGTTGLTTWPASMALASYLTLHADLVQGKAVLELGSGAGLLGIVVATLQIRSQLGGSLCLTDGRSDVVQRCEQNVALTCNVSSCHNRLDCRQLDWQDALDASTTFAEDIGFNPDLVIGADIVFDPTITPALIATLHKILQGTTCIALLALTIRNAATIAEFLNAAKQLLVVEQVPHNTKETIFAGTSGNYTIHEVQIFQIACNPTMNK